MIKAVYPVFLILNLFALLTNAQQSKTSFETLINKAWSATDSDPKLARQIGIAIYQKAKVAGDKKNELNALNIISNAYWSERNYSNAKVYAKKGLSLATVYQLKSFEADFNNTLGLISYSINDYRAAVKSYESAYYLFAGLKMEKYMGITLMNIGMARRKLSEFEIANQNYFRAAEIFEKLGDHQNLSGLYNAIGNSYIALHKAEKAVPFYFKALKIAEQLKEEPLIAQSYNNIGYAFVMQKKPDSALTYLEKCLNIRIKEKDSGAVVLTLQNLAVAWKQKPSLSKATGFLERSILIAEKLGMRDELLRGTLDLAELYQQKKELTIALKTVLTAELLAKELKSKDLLLEAYDKKSSILEALKDYKGAFLVEQQRKSLNLEIFGIEEAKRIQELEVKYETNKKITDIAALHKTNALSNKIVSQQKTFIYFLIGASLLLMLILGFTIVIYIQKKKANQHVKSLVVEIHHRVKNNLQILSSLLTIQLEETDNEQVKQSIWENEMRLNSMNLIHQQLYMSDSDTKIEMQDYFIGLANNIHISFGSKGKSVKLDINVAQVSIDAEKAVPLGLIVNELITNAFKYAIEQPNPTITLSFKRKNEKYFSLSVADNGLGLSNDTNVNGDRKFGTKLVGMMAKQLRAEMNVSNNPGLTYQFNIPHLS